MCNLFLNMQLIRQYVYVCLLSFVAFSIHLNKRVINLSVMTKARHFIIENFIFENVFYKGDHK